MTSLLPPTFEPETASGEANDGGGTDERPPAPGPRPAAIGALLAVGWTAPTGALLCVGIAVTGWLLGGHTDASTAPAAARLGTNAWLLTHHAAIRFGDETFGLAPLGLGAALAVICFLAGGWIARTSELDRPFDVGIAIGCYTLCYGGFAALAALLARTGSIAVSPWHACWNAGVLAGVAAAAGLLYERGDLAYWVRTSPPRLRTAVRAACYGVTGLLAAGTLIVLVALVLNGQRIAEFGRALHPGASGWVVLGLICLVYLPNAALYAVSYLLGPGFALGVGTVVSPTTVALGPLPTFPLLAAVPQNGAAASWLLVVLLVPLGAGVLAGVVVYRRHPDLSPSTALLYGGGTGVLMALAVSGLVTLAGGSAGPGRMADFGAATAWVLLTSLLLCTAGAIGGAAALPCWRRWGSPRLAAGKLGTELAVARSPRDLSVESGPEDVGIDRQLGAARDGRAQNVPAQNTPNRHATGENATADYIDEIAEDEEPTVDLDEPPATDRDQRPSAPPQ